MPIAGAVYYSFYKWTASARWDRRLRQLQARPVDNVFRHAIGHNLIIAVLSCGPAAALDRPSRCCSTAGSPGGRSCACGLRAVRAVRGDHRGGLAAHAAAGRLVDQTAARGRAGRAGQQWLADATSSLYTLFIVVTWKYIGFGMILLLAGLQGIPVECTRRPPSTARPPGR